MSSLHRISFIRWCDHGDIGFSIARDYRLLQVRLRDPERWPQLWSERNATRIRGPLYWSPGGELRLIVRRRRLFTVRLAICLRWAAKH